MSASGIFRAVCVFFFALLAAMILLSPETVLAEMFPKIHANSKDSIRDEVLRGLMSLGLGAAVCCVTLLACSLLPTWAPGAVVATVATFMANEQMLYWPWLAAIPYAPSNMKVQGAVAGALVAAIMPGSSQASAKLVVMGVLTAEGVFRLLKPDSVVETWPLVIAKYRDPFPAHHYAMCCGVFYLAAASAFFATFFTYRSVAPYVAMLSVISLLELHNLTQGSPARSIEFQAGHPGFFCVIGTLTAIAWCLLLAPAPKAKSS